MPKIPSKSQNQGLAAAKAAKKDEFYTQITDIEKEIVHYRPHLKGATIFCNCDDPVESNFFRYFALNFEFLGLKKLITTHYDSEKPTYKLEITRELDVNDDGKIDMSDAVKTPLQTNGDFRSPESIELLKEADIVVTNPPFSLFSDYIKQLMEYNKKFLVIGNTNAVTYKEIFPYIKDEKMWIGATNYNVGMWFEVPDHYEHQKEENGKRLSRVSTSCWFTNMPFPKRYESLPLFKTYSSKEYPKYDNYDAIEVSKVAEIPEDYNGVMGVPITFLGKWNPNQFKIVGCSYDYGRPDGWDKDFSMSGTINGKSVYKRLLIQKKEGAKQ